MPCFNRGANELLGVTTDLLTHTIKVALMKTSYSFDRDAHNVWSDVSTSEIVATNYTAGGSALASKTITEDDTNDRSEFDAADLTFTSIGGGTNDTIGSCIIYRDSGTASTSPLLAHIDLTDTTTNGGNITIAWDAEGIIQLSTV